MTRNLCKVFYTEILKTDADQEHSVDQLKLTVWLNSIFKKTTTVAAATETNRKEKKPEVEINILS